ncbi:TetR/AcrR family transcriptional regulator [Oricola thermophila]|uniref:TetR/AcrR family transcriptional regulator n=1 Tax=Oricola thermophila TaxID=2742145 RepID=A0A6N1VHC3_9HYPH|nr:TetR/AcrR family transcriptional regulator [Oricola thermophila]QKV19853.1 TetR/AcrR family transcriptional regulator [Oricola thermophila]
MQATRDKREIILAAAVDVFLNYGFRKTSMDDIARAAGMSRPALYQVFRNKTEIFRATSMNLLELKVHEVRAAFRSDKPFRERLFDSLDRSFLALHRQILETPHGSELIDVNEDVACDIKMRYCDQMVDALAEGISDAARSGEIALEPLGVDARAAATIIMQAMEGIKAKCMRGEPADDDVRNMVTFVAGALTAGKPAD